MRLFIVVLLYVTSICFSQEKHHNQEFGFSIEFPSEWNITFEDQWSDEFKSYLHKCYASKPLFILKPNAIEVSDSYIMIFGRSIDDKNSSIAKALVEQSAKKMMTSDILAKEILGEGIREYHKVDTYYNYNSSKNLSISKLVYQQENRDDSTYIAAWSKFFNPKNDINLRGWSKSMSPEDFWGIFQSVSNSVKFDSKNYLEEHSSDKQTATNIWKWLGIILTISIILGFLKMLFSR